MKRARAAGAPSLQLNCRLKKFRLHFSSSRILFKFTSLKYHRMNKRQLIEKAEAILRQFNFIQSDYVFSMQGPTLILSLEGTKKMTQEIRNKIEGLDVIVL